MNLIIMDRHTLVELAKQPFEEHTAVISITNSADPEVELIHQPADLLRLTFDDVSDEIFEEILGRKPSVVEMHRIASRFHMLSNHQTQLLAQFILKRNNRGTLICQCEHGQSRSAAVAAAVLEYHSQKGIQIFTDSRYYPNKYVFRKLLRALRNLGVSSSEKKKESC